MAFEASMSGRIERMAMRQCLAFVFVFLGVLLAAEGAAKAQYVLPFHRGVAIHDAMNWATMDSTKKTYAFPPFSDAAHPFSADELAAIKNAGFDFVRLTVDPGPFLQFEGAQLDGTYGILRQRVQAILDAGLGVVVDFHPVQQDRDYGPFPVVAGIDAPMFNAYCRVVSRAARMLTDLRSDRIALELMNEPAIGGTLDTDTQWHKMQEKLYEQVRGTSPALPLVLAGGEYDAVERLLTLDPRPFAKDPHVLFTFHFYKDGFFTHQTFEHSDIYRVATQIPYPAQARPLSETMGAIYGRIDEIDKSVDQRMKDVLVGSDNLIRYRASGFNRDSIHSDFEKVASWAQRYGINPSRIWLGEFGVIRNYGRYKGALDDDRARWLHDVRTEAESHGFFWSVWTYRGYGGMAIVKDDSYTATEIDPVTLKALGLR